VWEFDGGWGGGILEKEWKSKEERMKKSRQECNTRCQDLGGDFLAFHFTAFIFLYDFLYIDLPASFLPPIVHFLYLHFTEYSSHQEKNLLIPNSVALVHNGEALQRSSLSESVFLSLLFVSL
jgi:hypothetical protein